MGKQRNEKEREFQISYEFVLKKTYKSVTKGFLGAKNIYNYKYFCVYYCKDLFLNT